LFNRFAVGLGMNFLPRILCGAIQIESLRDLVKFNPLLSGAKKIEVKRGFQLRFLLLGLRPLVIQITHLFFKATALQSRPDRAD